MVVITGWTNFKGAFHSLLWILKRVYPTWDPFTASNIKALTKVQRQATRWVKHDARTALANTRAVAKASMQKENHRAHP